LKEGDGPVLKLLTDNTLAGQAKTVPTKRQIPLEIVGA
jgi:hypothetical protein